jgi:alpha-glucosidase
MKHKYMALSVLATAFAVSFAQAQPVVSAGNVESAVVDGQQVHLKLTRGQADITVYSPSVIRVRVDKQAFRRDFSYAVVAPLEKTATTFTQDAREVVIATPTLTARIAKQPFAVTFTTPDGKVISQDEPGLQVSWIGEDVTSYKKLQEGERFIGLGEKTGNLDRRGSAYTNWNSDTFAYRTDADPLYSSIPFFIGAHHGLSYGIFFDNSYQTDFNFGASNNRFSSFGAHGGEMNYYFIHQPKVADIIGSYTALTGRMPLPPLWSLGYQQNRYSYYPEAEVMRIAQTLREKKIPADGITLDIDYMDAYKLFTWDKARFPNPKAMTSKLAAMGIKTTVIVDPGIKVEKGYGAYDRGIAGDVFIKYADATNYTGEVWPGWCHFPDFTSVRGREWWQKEVKTYADAGVAGIWNDMNEISTWGQKMPNNVLFDFDGQPTSHKEAHNVYALEMTRASYDGMVNATGKRPFLLTRAGYAGLQRYSAIWTGDNRAEEDHMLLGVRLLNSLGVSGVAFTGMDVGGFTQVPTRSLFAKWMQIGAFNPYFRNHAGSDSKSSEPWTFGEDILKISRDAVNLRYRLMPYLYSAFADAATTGAPVMRTLAIDYTHDPEVYNHVFQNQYMFGKAFLVAPFESTKQYGKVHFPQGLWYDLYTDEAQAGSADKIVELTLDRLPVWVKAGSVVPVQSLVQSTSEKPLPTLALHIYKGENGLDATSYYEDDGESFGYRKGAFYRRAIAYDAAARTIEIGAVEGSYRSKFDKLDIVLHGFGDAPKLAVNGKAVAVKAGAERYTVKLGHTGGGNPENGSVVAGKARTDGAVISSAVIGNDSGKIVISYK